MREHCVETQSERRSPIYGKAAILVGMTIVSSAGGGRAHLVRVPADQPTIQAGIDAAWRGGGIVCADASPAVNNCIFWGNDPDQIVVYGGEAPAVSYCDVEGGWGGEGNIERRGGRYMSAGPELARLPPSLCQLKR